MDNVNDQARVGQHRDVAAVDSVRCCTHSLCQEPLQIRLNRAVVVGDDVPTRLRLPGGARCIPAEEVGSRSIVGRPDNLLLLLREVSREAHDALWTHLDAPVCDFDDLNTSVTGNFSCWLCEVSSASGASAAM